ncbi:MAG: DUF4296 domain-containing protein [Bacteroidota bacterium]|nr:DUF4296 domain-containing protein [Bacteroidota bacterium]
MRIGLVILLGVVFLSLTGCHNGDDKILSQREMMDVLYDMHLTDAMSASMMSHASPMYTSDELYNSVLKKHKITTKAFENSIYYYTKHPKQYARIYQQLSDRLNEEIQKTSGMPSGKNAERLPVNPDVPPTQQPQFGTSPTPNNPNTLPK